MPWEPKQAFGTVASFCAARLVLPGHGFCAQFLGGMEQMEEDIRSSGQYSARVEVPGGADTQTRLLDFIGCDPFWLGR